MTKLYKLDLLRHLQAVIVHVESSDSFQGTISYDFIGSSDDPELGPGECMVSGGYRVGNLQGQGGMVVVG